MKKALALWVFAFLLLLSGALAHSIDSYDIEFYIIKNKVVAEHKITSSSSLSGINIRIPDQISGESFYSDGELIDFPSNEGYAMLPSSLNARFNYITKDYLDRENFVFSFIAPADIKKFSIKLVLPENAALKKPFSLGDLTTGSAYPSPDQALSDGKSIVLIWQRGIMQGEEMPVFVGFKTKTNYTPLTILLILLLALAVIYILFRKPPIVVKKEDSIEQHLKEDEEQVINIIKQRGGHKIEQGTLRVITGFSKATLSRLLTELEQRKVIFKEKRGKKNLIFLKK